MDFFDEHPTTIQLTDLVNLTSKESTDTTDELPKKARKDSFTLSNPDQEERLENFRKISHWSFYMYSISYQYN